MNDFMGKIEAKFAGTDPVTSPPHPVDVDGQDFWTTFGSDASDVNMTSRISQTEVVESSTNANSKGMRYFALTSITAIEFLNDDMPANVRETVATKSISNIKTAIDGINQQRSKLGLSEGRVSQANDALKAQQSIIETHLIDLEGIDTYEAKTRIDLLKSQIEIAYNLTARLQEMSLVNFL
jgi:flagellar hook-associated protein 3 FlgL